MVAPDLAPAVRDPDRLLDLPDEPGAGRRLEGDVLRKSRAKRMTRTRRRSASRTWPAWTRPSRSCTRSRSSSRTRRSSRRSARGSRRACCSTGRPAPARRCSRAPSRVRRGSVLLHLWLRLRRDVRRRRRLARPRPVRAGEAGGAVHRLHGRDRRGRPPSRRRTRRRPRRARADAEPAPRRDGRVRAEGQHHPDRGHEPARHPRPGAAAPGALRPADRRRPTRPGRPQEDPRGSREGQADRPGGRPRHLAAGTPASPAPTSPTS